MRFQWFSHKAAAMAGLAIAATIGTDAMAQEATCPLPGQKPTLMVQMFFGQSIRKHRAVTNKQWNTFLRQTVTPRFPDGLTVYDSYGQWQDPDTKTVVREKSKVILIATADTAPARQSIAEISEAYRELFQQQSVAIASNSTCIAF